MCSSVDDIGLGQGEERPVLCPRCHQAMDLVDNWRARGAAIGAVSGAALSFKGARVGAVAGACLLPGVGAILGMATGALLGAATGAALGDAVDRDIVARYICPACGSTCRLND